MRVSTYRDMHLLNELTRTPGTTQRELSKRIGAALGLTNLMLRRLAKKGYIKITGTKRNRIHYLITPKGILEKSRLTYEFIEYSLQLYGHVRQFLERQLAMLAQTGHRRVLLYGTGELAEIAFLVVREIGRTSSAGPMPSWAFSTPRPPRVRPCSSRCATSCFSTSPASPTSDAHDRLTT